MTEEVVLVIEEEDAHMEIVEDTKATGKTMETVPNVAISVIDPGDASTAVKKVT